MFCKSLKMLDLLLYQTSEQTFGFKHQGKGILNRASKYEKAWLPHITNTKKQITSWAENSKSKKEISILGAGHLLDVPLDSIKNNFNQIYLSDANINCVTTWCKFFSSQKNVYHAFYDITATLSHWLNHLRDIKADHSVFIKELNSLSIKNKSIFIKAKNILSLNLLSQLPIYWQHAASQIFINKYGHKFYLKKEEDLNLALLPSSRLLIKAHLDYLIPNLKNESRLIIFDKTFYFPNNPEVSFDIVNQDNDWPKIVFNHLSNSSQIIYEQDALCGLSISDWLKNLSPKIKYKIENNWLWEIVPKGVKEPQEIHLVSALSLTT